VHGDLQCRHAASVAQRQSPFPDLQTRVRLRPVRCGTRCHDGLMNDPIVSNVKSAGALRTLTWTNLAAQSAEQISLAAVPIVAVMVLQAGAGQIGALSTAQTLPFLLLSIPMGVLADRWSRARLMVLAEGVRALSLLALWLLVGYGALSLGALALLGFIGAAGTVGFTVAAPALVPSLVPQDALARANARLELARSAAFAAGPARARPSPAPPRCRRWACCCCCACPRCHAARGRRARCSTSCATVPRWCG